SRSISSDQFYRVAWRRRGQTTNLRTLFPAIIPVGAKHIHPVYSAAGSNDQITVLAGAFASSMISDFYIRTTGKGEVNFQSFAGVPMVSDSVLEPRLIELFLRLNCLTSAYSA